MISPTQLFNKSVSFTDIHFGLKANSTQHNQDCIDFIKWMISVAHARDAETCFFLGDYHHHRCNINLVTQNYMLEGMKLLNDNFKQTYFLVGNHDLFWRDRRDVSSTKFASLFPNITFIDQLTEIGNVALLPWLIGDEWKSVPKMRSKYLFGHLELPGYKMNAQVVAPDHGTLCDTHFKNQDYVFSGHFHIRQTKGKISYIGNPFGHNFSDTWAADRGMMFLEWDQTPEYINYDNGPKYITATLSSILERPEHFLKPKTYAQVLMDLDITFEEATSLKDTFVNDYDVREFKLMRPKVDVTIDQNVSANLSVKSVDEIVTEQLMNVDSKTYSSQTLMDIYNNL